MKKPIVMVLEIEVVCDEHATGITFRNLRVLPDGSVFALLDGPPPARLRYDIMRAVAAKRRAETAL